MSNDRDKVKWSIWTGGDVTKKPVPGVQVEMTTGKALQLIRAAGSKIASWFRRKAD